MATPNKISELVKQLDRVLGFKKEDLITRPEWGEINLENARQDFLRIFDLANHLKLLPVELLPDAVIQQTQERLKQVADLFQRISQFRIGSDQNPSGTRNSFINEVHNHADNLFTTTAPWVPFLAYQKGDVAKNIQSLTDAVSRAEALVTETKGKIENRAREIEEIIAKAREASAAAGAAVFTRDFQTAAKELEDDARRWLRATAWAAVVTLVVALGLWAFSEGQLDQGQLFQKLSTKLVVLALLLTATIWCGRNYKALKHLAVVNRHRAMSIQTLQAFSAAASDAHAKDAVLLEVTRAVFGNVSTGYIDGAGADSDLKVIEVARSILPKADK